MHAWHTNDIASKDDRRLLALCSITAAASHVPLIPEHLREVPYLGWAFVAFVVVSAATAVAALTVRSLHLLTIIGVLNAGAIGAYVLSRTVGLPGMSDDIGKWTEPWSIPALTAECIAIAAALAAMRSQRIAWTSPIA